MCTTGEEQTWRSGAQGRRMSADDEKEEEKVGEEGERGRGGGQMRRRADRRRAEDVVRRWRAEGEGLMQMSILSLCLSFF